MTSSQVLVGYFANILTLPLRQRIPHPIVWVRLRNYPEWPAKVIEEVRHRDEYRVRTKFFGAHDYAEVPYSCVTFHTPIKAAVDPKTLQVEHFKEALDELQVRQDLQKMGYVKSLVTQFRKVLFTFKMTLVVR